MSVIPTSIDLKTRLGVLRGSVTDGVASFRGIPFAAAPFGANRFRRPQPVPGWDGIRDATGFGAGCPQRSLDPNPQRTAYFNPTVTGPDCLNLNVWTPEPAGAGLPVMVWIHGGGYMTGGGAAPLHDGHTWARDGVVYVSINYRMHVEGFLRLAGGEANLGLHDQIAALRWVQEHIADFGGDPGNVTIFGQSAGGVSVMHLLAMPEAAGLFRRAIAQSGSTRVICPPELGDRIAARAAELLGVAPTADAVRDLSTERVLDAVVQLAFEYLSPAFWGTESFLISPFRPTLDESLPVEATAAVRGGMSSDVDLMAGWTTDEATFAMQPFGLLERLEPVWLEAARTCFGVTAVDPTPADMAMAWTDFAFRQPTHALLAAHAAGPARTYGYEFTWPSPTFPELGSTHALELPFVGDSLRDFIANQPPNENLLGDAPPQDLADRMHRAWIAFATTGDPGWAAYPTVEQLPARQ